MICCWSSALTKAWIRRKGFLRTLKPISTGFNSGQEVGRYSRHTPDHINRNVINQCKLIISWLKKLPHTCGYTQILGPPTMMNWTVFQYQDTLWSWAPVHPWKLFRLRELKAQPGKWTHKEEALMILINSWSRKRSKCLQLAFPSRTLSATKPVSPIAGSIDNQWFWTLGTSRVNYFPQGPRLRVHKRLLSTTPL